MRKVQACGHAVTNGMGCTATGSEVFKFCSGASANDALDKFGIGAVGLRCKYAR